MKKFLWGWLLFVVLLGTSLAIAYISGQKLSERIGHTSWGVVIRPFALSGALQPKTWKQSIDQQLAYAKELGVSVIRANIEYQDSVIDYLVDQAYNQGFELMLVLELPGSNPVLNNEIPINGLYNEGYNLAFTYTKRYAGKVKYYQLANEVTGNAVRKPEDTGPTLPNRFNLAFDKGRYERVEQYSKGLSDGVIKADPKAKRVITGNWVLVDIIQYLIDGGLNFEIVGWDWYSDMGMDPRAVKVDIYPEFDLPQAISQLGKEFWLVEVNRAHGSYNDAEMEQAAFLKTVALAAAKDPNIQGFIVHELPDGTRGSDQPSAHLGLIKVTKQSEEIASFTNKKIAFEALTETFIAYPKDTNDFKGNSWQKFSLTVYNTLNSRQ